jgi:hypothetical protein
MVPNLYRLLCAIVVLACVAPAVTAAPLTLTWADLVPDGAATLAVPGGTVDHDMIAALSLAPRDDNGKGPAQPPAPVRADLDGRAVRIPGFVVPLDFAGTKVKAFLLVPFVGACIHVPPPPSNQIVYVTFDKGFEFVDLFQAIWVEGTMSTQPLTTDLADVGYQLRASATEEIEMPR